MLRAIKYNHIVRSFYYVLHHESTRPIGPLQRSLIFVKRNPFFYRNIGDSKQATIKSVEPQKKIERPKKTIWQKVKHEAVHYWHGTKLLGLEIKISSRLVYKLLQGTKLSRQESRQLRRTSSDIVRVVPFAVFLIVPFMEFLLPVALKVFPNMLPSTFEDKQAKEEKKRKLLKVRLEMARFLQETMAESDNVSDTMSPTCELVHFFDKLRTTGKNPSQTDVLEITSKFKDEFTLDNFTRPQLVCICRYMNMNTLGTDNFLRFQIRNRLRRIKMDDEIIKNEGINSLTPAELNQACLARGISTFDGSPEILRNELNQWIDLHLEHNVPSILLLLSHAFSFTDKNTMSSATEYHLPKDLVNDASETIEEKLQALEKQEELIQDESKEARKSWSFKHQDVETKNEDHTSLLAEQHNDLQKALSNLSIRVDNLEQRGQLNEIKFRYEDYKNVIEELKASKDNESNTRRLGNRLERMLDGIDKELNSLENDNKTNV